MIISRSFICSSTMQVLRVILDTNGLVGEREKGGQHIKKIRWQIEFKLLSPRRQDTADGFEMTMGTNYLAPYLLTDLLLPLLKSTGKSGDVAR